eukprot:gene6948-14104_t
MHNPTVKRPSFERSTSRTHDPHQPRASIHALRTLATRCSTTILPQNLAALLNSNTGFDPSAVKERLDKMWALNAEFGKESNPYDVFLVFPDEIVSDRFALLNGMQVLRDELHMAFNDGDEKESDVNSCRADFSLPSVISTIAHTNCGDRVAIASNQVYESMVASRFASISELGELKPERFNPPGGGTDDGRTLAHVTVAHQLDPPLRSKIYAGNPKSFILVNFDLKTHCGKFKTTSDDIITDGIDTFSDISLYFGKCRESVWRDPRSACGALVGCLRSYDASNPVHIRLRNDLGEANYEFLTTHQILATPDKTPVTHLVASCIIAITGMISTASALVSELDERGVGSLTATVTINAASENIGVPDNIIYLGRATVFGYNKEIKIQSLGTDASLYEAFIENDVVNLVYNGYGGDNIPIETRHTRTPFNHK